jgi:hypothetical protein
MATSTGKDYSKIAAQKIKRPSEQEKRAYRILVYSRNKKGKTTFCMSPGQGNVLIVDPEDGTDKYTKADPHVWKVNTWEDMDDVYKFARSGKHDYSWFALDGLTRIGSMAVRYCANHAEEQDLNRKPGMIQLKDYGNAGKLMEAMLYNFGKLPYGLILTAQEKMMSGNEAGDEDDEAEDSGVYYVPDLQKMVKAAANSMVDVIGRLYTVKATVKLRNPKTEEVVEEERIQHRMWIQPHPAYDTGSRSEFESKLPPYLKNPTVPRLITLLENGKV